MIHLLSGEHHLTLDIFIDVTELNTVDVREDDLRARFRDAILDKNHGLRCILFEYHQYIILDNDEFDMLPFLQEITFDGEMYSPPQR